METKTKLRRRILTIRDTLGPAERREKSQAVIERLLKLDVFRSAQAVMLYVSFGSETGTQVAIQEALRAGKRVFVPDAVGILEVTKEGVERGNPKEIDLVVVPGIAFDLAGNRLGYGTGWYDKFSHRLKAGAELIGLAFECQIVEKVPNHPHDIQVHTIVTEQRIIHCV